MDIVERMRGQQEEQAREAHIESTYGLDLTGSAWSPAYHDELEAGLARLPASHVAPLDEIELGELSSGWGSHGDSVVHLATPSLVAAEKHPGDTSELAGHEDPIQQFAMTLIHEIGHDYHDNNPEVAARLLAAAGMQDGLRAGDLRRAGLDGDEIDSLAADDHNGNSYWEYAEVERDGMMYRNDKYAANRYVAYDAAAVPRGGAHSDGRDADSFYYARSSPHEYFAELYSKAVNVPELLHSDLVSGPAADLAGAQAGAAAAQAHLDEVMTSGDMDAILQALSAVEAANAAAESATRGQQAKQEQWDIMRGDVFGVTDELVEDRAGDVEALYDGTDALEAERRAAEFRARAAKCATPDQLERLFENYV